MTRTQDDNSVLKENHRRVGQEVAKPPMLFDLSRWLIYRGYRGGWRLWSLLHRTGALKGVAKYDIDGSVRQTPMFVPIFRKESSFADYEIADYDRDCVAMVVEQVQQYGAPVFLIDCGADIGMVSSAFVRECKDLTGVVAFEPNPLPYRYLSASAAEWSVPTTVLNAAVGEKSMRGRLVQSADDPSDHACYIVEDVDGDIEVVAVDSCDIPSNNTVILKVDVEGAELEVIKGTRRALENAAAFVVIFEAHPKVFARNGVEPMDIIRYLNEIKPTSVKIAEAPERVIDLDRGFFDQVGDDSEWIRNLICTSCVK